MEMGGKQAPNQARDLKAGEIELPAPTGPYAVGRVSFHWTADTKGQGSVPNSSGHREVMVHLWYPANLEAGLKPAPYVPGLETIEQQLKKPGDPIFDRLKLVHGHAVSGAKLSSSPGKFPILLFLHGSPGSSFQYASQTEELASHGYIVAGVESPNIATAVLFPDGRLIPAKPLPTNREELKEWGTNKGPIQQALDAQIALSNLEILNARDPGGRFTGRLDLNRIGVIGHSSGGRAAAYTCLIATRVKACLSMGGFPPPDQVIESGVTQPFMVMTNYDNLKEVPDEVLATRGMTREKLNALIAEHVRQRQTTLESAAKSLGYLVEIRGALHNSFSDVPFMFPETYRDNYLDGARVSRIIK